MDLKAYKKLDLYDFFSVQNFLTLSRMNLGKNLGEIAHIWFTTT